jgi:hypothetical protein
METQPAQCPVCEERADVTRIKGRVLHHHREVPCEPQSDVVGGPPRSLTYSKERCTGWRATAGECLSSFSSWRVAFLVLAGLTPKLAEASSALPGVLADSCGVGRPGSVASR